MRQTISLQKIPNQTLSTVLNEQVVSLNFYTTNKMLFCDFYLNKVLIQGDIKCNNAVNLLQYTSDFVGYLFFWDTLEQEPNYLNFGDSTTLNYSDTNMLEELLISQLT